MLIIDHLSLHNTGWGQGACKHTKPIRTGQGEAGSMCSSSVYRPGQVTGTHKMEVCYLTWMSGGSSVMPVASSDQLGLVNTTLETTVAALVTLRKSDGAIQKPISNT